MAEVSGTTVEKEYEKLNVKQEDIQKLMTWLSEQAHLPHQFITGKVLNIITFLLQLITFV